MCMPKILLGFTKIIKKRQSATLIVFFLFLESIVPVTAALLESQEVCKRCCICLDAETP